MVTNGVVGSTVDTPLSGAELVQGLAAKAEQTTALTIVWEGRSFTVRYKRLNWIAKARCVAAATTLAQAPNPITGRDETRLTFRVDLYKRAALKEMIVEFPIKLTDMVIDILDDEIGSQLDVIIPDPNASLEEADAVKKVSAISSEATAQ